MEDYDSIDLRGQEFQEVLGEPPSWLLKWGITAILVVIIVLFLLGCLIKSPESITAPIRLETSNPPKEVIAAVIGTISPIVSEKTQVEKGQVIAQIEDKFGDLKSILALDTLLSKYEASNRNVPNFAEIDSWDLGPVKSDYLKFFQAFAEPNSYSPNLFKQGAPNFVAKEKSIRGEITSLERQKAQKQLRVDKIPETRKKFQDTYGKSKSQEDNTKLHVLREEELNLMEGIDALNVQIAAKHREIQDLKYQKTVFEQDLRGEQITKQQNINIYLKTLQSKIEEWKKQHLIESPVKGTLVYSDKIKTKEYLVKEGQRIFAVIPPGAQDTIEGKLYLSSEEFIKVQLGQKVKIKFSAYRPSEFGLLNGTVSDKASLPENGQYQVYVSLDNGMQSSKGKTIGFEHQMQGEAQIITSERRLVSLIFEQFKEIIGRR